MFGSWCVGRRTPCKFLSAASASVWILATVLVYLILVAQFKSFFDPLLILLAVPTGLGTGVLITLFATGTTLNVMSLMGVVMMVGIVVSNSILIVEFTNRLRAEGRKPFA